MFIPENRPSWLFRLFALAFLLALAAVGILGGRILLRPRTVRGDVTFPESTMSLKDGRAIWQPTTGWLTLYLSPNYLPKTRETSAEPDDANAAHHWFIHEAKGSVEFTLVLSGFDARPPAPHIETVAFSACSPSAPDESRIFMQGHSEHSWIQAMSFTNGPTGSFITLASSGACSDELGVISWNLQVLKLPFQIQR